jgi:uncharacterized protein YbbC (DUF1343 family)
MGSTGIDKEKELMVEDPQQDPPPIMVGAEDIKHYGQFLKGKKIALVANQSSRVGSQHLLDTLLSLNYNIEKVFTPEHGFRGEEDAGAEIESTIDRKTSLPLISLYGKNKKPGKEQLEGIELLLFDLQDVGVRFYTYISTLHYVMEAAAENGITVVVLDRPNPHMNTVDGPVMQKEFMSFVGLHPVPLLYGMTIGEYAKMINNEAWLANGVQCKLIVVGCGNLKRNSHYELPIPPSPNLPNMQSIQLYPSLALFEGTPISVGRGTNKPFQQFGHPSFSDQYTYYFSPEPIKGAQNPKLKGKKCYGMDLSKTDTAESMLDLSYLLTCYNNYPQKEEFFNSFFDLLAGTSDLKKQIIAGLSEDEIEKGIEEFFLLRIIIITSQ